MDQRELVERARQGDHDAFAVLVNASITRLEAVARLIVRDPEIARDAVQEGYLRAWRDLRGLRDPDRFDAWLYRLVLNACRDVARRDRRRVVEVPLGRFGPATQRDIPEILADHDRLERGFSRLGTDLRTVLVLHYYVGLSMPAVAEMLAIPLGTAQSRLGRALAAMRRAMDVGTEPEGSPVRRGQIV